VPTLLHDPSVLVWRSDRPWLAVSSAALGGGLGIRHWVINMTVPADYDRPDPDVHLATTAATLGLAGPGVGLMTAVDVAGRVTATDGGVEVTATVGLGHPTWAAAPDGHLRAYPGTINVVALLPVRLDDAALVNAVLTATEAKVQALVERGIDATGTASDAICVLCASDGAPEPYAGPRSTWGARLARAVHAAVLAGAAREW
jgi:adenosylcobinamide hydrolase